MNTQQRFPELDIWRGLAITGMVVFHVIFILDFLNVRSFAYDEGAWHLLARLVQWSFLLLVGIGMQLRFQRSKNKPNGNTEFLKRTLRRSLIVFAYAALVSVGSFIYAPDVFIQFGILHFIATSLIILSPLVAFPNHALVLSAVVYISSLWVRNISLAFTPLAILGVTVPEFAALDHFPIFPWLAIPLLGIWLGAQLFQDHRRQYPDPNPNAIKILRPLATIGKKTLLIYLFHAPIIVGVILLAQEFSS